MATLFEKVKFGSLELKNRVFMAPMGFSTSDLDGGLSDRQIEYCVERAKGGFGLIFSGAHFVTTAFDSAPLPNVLENYSQAVRVSLLADRVHHYGAKLCMQLSLGFGRLNFDLVDPSNPPYSASAVPSFWAPHVICKPLTKENIDHLVNCCGASALMAKNAGADAIELLAVGGYMIDQFVNPVSNKRTDEYGGSLQNRLRIVYELRDEVWKTCGKDFPILIKVTLDHCTEEGIRLEEGIEVAKALDNAGFTMLHLDKGFYYSALHMAIPTVYQKEGLHLNIAEAMRKQGIKTPILVQGKLGRPEFAEKVVREGISDLVGLGRQAIADPHWPNKVTDHKYDEIIPCIGCSECLRSVFSNRAFTCAVNPLTGAEKDYALTPAQERKSILVVGAGPAGMMSAITAAKRGFDVELWEKGNEYGGALLAAAAPEFKTGMAGYAAYLKRQVLSHGVDVRLGSEATAEDIIGRNPDVAIIAGGAKPIMPDIPGIDRDNVRKADAVLIEGDCPGDKVVVLGGGLVGCETALCLESMGKEVTIVEILDDLLLTVEHAINNDTALRQMMAASNVKVLTGATIKSVDDGKVTISSGGTEDVLPCDTVVIAIGYQADKSLAEAIESKIGKVFVIGDNVRPGKVIDAVHQGFHTIRLLEDLRS